MKILNTTEPCGFARKALAPEVSPLRCPCAPWRGVRTFNFLGAGAVEKAHVQVGTNNYVQDNNHDEDKRGSRPDLPRSRPGSISTRPCQSGGDAGHRPPGQQCHRDLPQRCWRRSFPGAQRAVGRATRGEHRRRQHRCHRPCAVQPSRRWKLRWGYAL